MQPYGIVSGYAIRLVGYSPRHRLNQTYIISSKKRKMMLRNLMPNSKYTTQVAAVTSAGIGPFSNPVTFFTQGSKSCIIYLLCMQSAIFVLKQ